MCENQSLAELPNHHWCHVLYLLEVLALSYCFQTQLVLPRSMEVSRGHPRARPASVMLPPWLHFHCRQNPTPSVQRWTSTPMSSTTVTCTWRITFLKPMVHFFGAQYNTIFSRYMWVQLDRKRNKALEKMQLPHSLENVPFVGWGHLLSKHILISSVTEEWLPVHLTVY